MHIPFVIVLIGMSFLEISVIKPNPAFMNPKYSSPDEIRERWYQDMYGDSNPLKGGNL